MEEWSSSSSSVWDRRDAPNVLQPTEAYCTNPALGSPVISRGAPHQTMWEASISERRNYGREMFDQTFIYNCDFHSNCRVLLHAAKLRHGTDGFTSPPKEGMLRIFSPRKIRRFRPSLNPRTWVPEASMLTTRPSKPLRVELQLLLF
jgi:hypothetical protein